MSNRRSAVALVMAALLAGACACQSSEAGTNGKNGTNAPDAQVRILPANGDGKARPDQGITVAATRGKLEQVTAVQGDKPVSGYSCEINFIKEEESAWYEWWRAKGTKEVQLTINGGG